MRAPLLLAAPLLLSAPAIAQDGGGQWVVSVFGGVAHTPSTDIHLTESNGTDLTVNDVSWTDASFESPPYYGVRLTHWTTAAPNWGVALDFVHPKMISKLGEEKQANGSLAGAPVGGAVLLGDVFEALEFSHGHNILTVNGLYRWHPAARSTDPWSERWQPYVGLGLGVAIPHAEVETGNSATHEYQVVGPAANALAGVNLPISSHFGTFLEYRLTYADMEVQLNGGGQLTVEPWTHMLSFGLSYTF